MSVSNRVYPAGVAALLNSGASTLGAGSSQLLGSDFSLDLSLSDSSDFAADLVGSPSATAITVSSSFESGIAEIFISLAETTLAGYDGSVSGILVSLSDGTPLICFQEPQSGLNFPATLVSSDPITVGAVKYTIRL